MDPERFGYRLRFLQVSTKILVDTGTQVVVVGKIIFKVVFKYMYES